MKGKSPISKLIWWIQSGFNFNFRFEFEYRIHRTIKGNAFEWILGYLNASFEMTFLRENNHKTLHSTSFSTRSDDPALGRMIRPNSARSFGVSPDDPALGWMIWTWWLVSVQKCPRSDDPTLYRMIRTWEFWVCFGLFCSYPKWSEVTPDDPGTTRKHTMVTFGGGSIYTPSPPSFISLSLPDQPQLKNTKSSTSLHPRAWFLQGNT